MITPTGVWLGDGPLTDEVLAAIKQSYGGIEQGIMGKTINALVAEVERLRTIVPYICPHCGGRMDVSPGHIDRCYCLPVIREKNDTIAKMGQEVERLRSELQAYTGDPLTRIRARQPEVLRRAEELRAQGIDPLAEIERLQAEVDRLNDLCLEQEHIGPDGEIVYTPS